MADRESDLRALMDVPAQRAQPADGLVRAQHHRKTASGDKRWSRVEKPTPWEKWNSRCPLDRVERRDGCGKRSIAIP
ncbi:MAG TPA: hypothetical protein P5260_14800 [Candidatus Competibacter sp.]|nr:hypothetical protein [Candidatus Competibacter sp.]HRX62463.1 hypothetical protein [Candidatus Competibacter sp.]